jgi:hypothetical protein
LSNPLTTDKENKMKEMGKTENAVTIAKVQIDIELTTNVKIGKTGGGGGRYIMSAIRIFVTINIWGFLPSFLCHFWASRLLNFLL